MGRIHRVVSNIDLHQDWPVIKKTFEAGLRSSKHCAVASVDRLSRPHVTPIGFMFLRDDATAFYFEQHARTLPDNLAHNKQVCVLVVNSGLGFWLRSLVRGRFPAHPGVRLHGEVGELRPATPAELKALAARIGRARWLKGSRLIWSGLHTVRDIHFTGVAPVRYPRMMELLP